MHSLANIVRVAIVAVFVLVPGSGIAQSVFDEQRDFRIAATSEGGFQRWLKGFRSRALRQGISPVVFDRFMAFVEYKPRVLELDAHQPEFTKTLYEYIDTVVPPSRIRDGRRALRANRSLLARIEKVSGVDARVLMGIWGVETSFGSFMGGTDVLDSLATLAYDGRRRNWAERELIGALRILQNGETTPNNMEGSWAGAMGHTQFVPTSYLAYAVDFTGDGKRDVWSDNPADALASTANYLRTYGWKTGQPWGMEVRLPANFDYALANFKPYRPISFWKARGVRTTDGKPVPNHGNAGLWTPAGHGGPAFIIWPNFFVIKRYNNSSSYVTAVGHLSDRIYGGGPFQAAWPKDTRPLNRAETRTLQRLLTARGFNTQGIDGLIGPKSKAAIRAFQRSQGLVPDGNATLALLKRLQ